MMPPEDVEDDTCFVPLAGAVGRFGMPWTWKLLDFCDDGFLLQPCDMLATCLCEDPVEAREFCLERADQDVDSCNELLGVLDLDGVKHSEAGGKSLGDRKRGSSSTACMDDFVGSSKRMQRVSHSPVLGALGF
mmetsp:Transcript_1353/g.2480  ORF Transcript_1353/g.2480 Transcript_1353/m.2480 type:complete len:133 (+) Transcript_1353:41-439(+)